MPKGIPKTTKVHIEKCRAAAIAAVESYNRPGPRFRTAQYLVLIVIAWQAFFHSYFFKKNRKPWYENLDSKTRKSARYRRVDGEPLHWDLSKCLKEYFRANNPPERTNLEFLLGLRNKVEHRHLPEFDSPLYGECQAALMNLEDYLAKEFGDRYSLAESLAISLQFSRAHPPEKKKAVKKLASGAKTVTEYIEQFRGSLTDQVLNDMGYSYSVYLVPKVGNRKSATDASIEFFHTANASPEEQDRLKKLNVLIKEKHIPIANLGLMKPGGVVNKVAADIPFNFNMHHHTEAWKHFKVRPKGGSEKPEHTNQNYCIFDKVHKDYLYQPAWVEKLVLELSQPDKFQNVTGKPPKARTGSKVDNPSIA